MTNIEARNARRAAAIEALKAHANSGEPVYNADFTEWKDMANRAFEDASREVQRVYLDGDRSIETDTTLYFEMPHGLHNFPSKKFVKLVTGATDSATKTAVLALIGEWESVAEAIKIVKATVIKGRKPRTSERATPERTIENTGTCACCGKNVKLKDGKIVNHGYTVRYGFFEGGCFGVGYPPIETSPEGAQAYLAVLIGHKDRIIAVNTDEAIAATVARMDEKERRGRNDETMARIVRANNDSMLRMLTRDIETFGRIVNEWTARPLPDAA